MGNFFGTMNEYFDGFLKTVLFYFVVLFTIRLLGKREVGEISVFDLVILLMIADIAVNGIDENNVPIMFYIVCLAALLILQKLVAYIVLKIPMLRNIFDGKPSVVIFRGKFNYKELKKQNYTIDDLIAQVRDKGAMSLEEIQMAILESSGELSVFLKEKYPKEILPVIVSGKIVKESLEFLHLKEADIRKYLKKENLAEKEVMYLASDGQQFMVVHGF